MLWLYEPVFPKYAYLVLIIVIGYVKVQQWFCHNWLIDQWPKKSCFSSCSSMRFTISSASCYQWFFYLISGRRIRRQQSHEEPGDAKGPSDARSHLQVSCFLPFDAKNASVSQVFFNVPELSQSKAARVAFKGWVGTYSYLWFKKKSWDKFCCSAKLFEPSQVLHLASV